MMSFRRGVNQRLERESLRFWHRNCHFAWITGRARVRIVQLSAWHSGSAVVRRGHPRPDDRQQAGRQPRKGSRQMSDELTQLFSEVLEVPLEDLSDDSSPQNVKHWDSLAAMRLVSAIEERFSVRLSTKDIMKMSSIGLARANLRRKNVNV